MTIPPTLLILPHLHINPTHHNIIWHDRQALTLQTWKQTNAVTHVINSFISIFNFLSIIILKVVGKVKVFCQEKLDHLL